MNLHWQDRAACATPLGKAMDWSPTTDEARLQLAYAFCSACPVRPDCLQMVDDLTGAGWPPQEVVLAGWWFPAVPNRPSCPPTDLLAAGGPVDEDIAA